MSHASHSRTPRSQASVAAAASVASVRVCRFRVHRFRARLVSPLRLARWHGQKFDQNQGLSLTSHHAVRRRKIPGDQVYRVRVTVYICMPHLHHPIPYKQHYPPHTWFPPLPHFTAPDLCKPGPQSSSVLPALAACTHNGSSSLWCIGRDNASSQVAYAPGKRKDRFILRFRSVGHFLYPPYSTPLLLSSPRPLFTQSSP